MQNLSFGHRISYYEAITCTVYSMLPSKIRLLGQAPSLGDTQLLQTCPKRVREGLKRQRNAEKSFRFLPFLAAAGLR